MEAALVERLLDLGRAALRRAAALPAEFFSPEERAALSGELAVLPGIRVLFYGGYRRASRQRLVLAPECLLIEAIDPGLACFSIIAAGGKSLPKEDCLRALCALGVPRGMIGDLLPIGGGCQAVMAAEYAESVQAGLRRIGEAEVAVAAIEPEALQAPPIQEKTIRSTVSSPRLDAVAADGFGVSRTKMARLIRAGIVRVNWQPVMRPDKLLAPGDAISIRGRGRVEVVSLAGETKKGRLGLVLKRIIC